MARNQFDLSEIALKEHYKLNILARFGGKVKYYLKIAALRDKVQHHCRLGQFFEFQNKKDLHRCLVGILNAAFQELPESFDLQAHFQQRHQNLLNAGMKASDFDAFVMLFEELLWDTAVDESLVLDTVQMLQALRGVFVSIEQETSHRSLHESLASKYKEEMNNRGNPPQCKEESKVNGSSIWELVEQRKQEKIASRRAKLELSQSKKLQKNRQRSSKIKKSFMMEDSQRSVSIEEMTVLSADELYDLNWNHPGYQSWNNVVCATES